MRWPLGSVTPWPRKARYAVASRAFDATIRAGLRPDTATDDEIKIVGCGRKAVRALTEALAETAGRTWIVTRHLAVLPWLGRRGYVTAEDQDVAEIKQHLSVEDENRIYRGDTVIGVLPIQIVARLTGRGVTCLLLEMQVPPEARGRELSVEDMESYDARLVRVTATITPV